MQTPPVIPPGSTAGGDISGSWPFEEEPSAATMGPGATSGPGQEDPSAATMGPPGAAQVMALAAAGAAGLPGVTELAIEMAAAHAGQDPEYQPPAPQQPARPAGPELIHSGTYALWRTPKGLYHLTYRRTAGTDPDSGQVLAIEGAPDVHMRDLPEHAAQMVAAVLDRDQELPPMLASFLFGNPLSGGKTAIMRQVAGMMKESGGIDELIAFAQNGGPAGADAME